MKEKIIDKLVIVICMLFVAAVLYIGYTVVTRINAKKEIKNNIQEICKDYEIKDLKDIKIKIHSKTNYQTKITYNVELTTNEYDNLEKDIQEEIIRYIKNIAFKGNRKKYYVNKVTIRSNDNVYTYEKMFKKNNQIYSNMNEYTDKANDIKDKIKDKYNEIKEKIIK